MKINKIMFDILGNGEQCTVSCKKIFMFRSKVGLTVHTTKIVVKMFYNKMNTTTELIRIPVVCNHNFEWPITIAKSTSTQTNIRQATMNTDDWIVDIVDELTWTIWKIKIKTV